MDRIVLHVTYTCRPDQGERFVKALRDSGLQAAVRPGGGRVSAI